MESSSQMSNPSPAEPDEPAHHSSSPLPSSPSAPPPELHAASVFLSRFLSHTSSPSSLIPDASIITFTSTLSLALWERCRGHWYTDNPSRGQVWRQVWREAERVDPILLSSLATIPSSPTQSTVSTHSSLNPSSPHPHLCRFPLSFILWIDPGSVTYRAGSGVIVGVWSPGVGLGVGVGVGLSVNSGRASSKVKAGKESNRKITGSPEKLKDADAKKSNETRSPPTPTSSPASPGQPRALKASRPASPAVIVPPNTPRSLPPPTTTTSTNQRPPRPPARPTSPLKHLAPSNAKNPSGTWYAAGHTEVRPHSGITPGYQGTGPAAYIPPRFRFLPPQSSAPVSAVGGSGGAQAAGLVRAGNEIPVAPGAGTGTSPGEDTAPVAPPLPLPLTHSDVTPGSDTTLHGSRDVIEPDTKTPNGNKTGNGDGDAAVEVDVDNDGDADSGVASADEGEVELEEEVPVGRGKGAAVVCV
ncbi:hypothetical protein HDU93_005122 [Gonapodya sp. JEL0774]|nr:hypothetical protein HDU93_005122 [Gonapodya sp. JEL0774]